MGAGDLLRDLDSRILPPVARAMSRCVAGPIRTRLLTAVALLAVTVVLVAAVWTVDRAPVDDPASAELLRVGVVEGQSVPGYVRSAQADLAALLRPSPSGSSAVDETYALVTLGAYFAPDRIAAVLGRVSVAEVYTRAPLTGVQTQILRIPANQIPTDIVAGMLDVAQRRDRERADYLRLATALGDDDTRLRRAYVDAAQVASSEAAAYRSGCSCVFAAVVRATPAAMQLIAARREVWAVDPAPEVHRLDLVTFIPPLPEQALASQRSVTIAPLPTRTALPSRPARSAITESSSSPSRAVISGSLDGPRSRSESPVEATGGRTAVPSALLARPTATTTS